ncbi:hypothetical protein KZX29_08340 [Moraxella osloensis]|uniref:DUF6683 family protein n=1 Tax=Faucicola osloensis TaxID=34062 RepID=UPI002003B3AB|nr:DUF6683 family protein [Moraxella osloensis]MCK6158799.1 hypothetical protein [Moraxella osloensis]
MKKRLIALMLGAVMSLGTVSTSQAYFTVDTSGFNFILGQQLLGDQVLKSSYEKGKSKSSAKSTTQTKKSTQSSQKSNQATQTTKSGTHRFTYSSGVTKQVDRELFDYLRQHLQAQGKLDSTNQYNLNQLKNANLIPSVRNALKSDGYNPNSIATAMAYVATVNYGIVNRQDLSTLKAHGMVHQLEAVIDESAEFRNMSNADKQRMADKLYWVGSLQMMVYIQAQQSGNQSAINTAIKDSRTVLSQLGLSTNQIAHGSNGLEIR